MTLLEKMNSSRIFDVTVAHCKQGFLIREACDNYFDIMISKKDLKRLGEELIEMANNPEVKDLDFEPVVNS